MIIPASERRDIREHLARQAMEVTLSLLCSNRTQEAMEALERTLILVGLLDHEDDVPDWVLASPDLLREKPPS